MFEYHAYVRPAAIAVLPIIEKSAETAKRIPADAENRTLKSRICILQNGPTGLFDF